VENSGNSNERLEVGGEREKERLRLRLRDERIEDRGWRIEVGGQ
jgi:hypothetical protein